MLRASIEYLGGQGDLRAVTAGAEAGDAGIPHGALLTRFAETAVTGDAGALAAARDALRARAGPAALVDAAAVVGNFQRMVRIADGTGIPLDDVMVGASEDFREALGLDAFQSRRYAELGPIGQIAAPVLRGLAKLGLRLAGWRARGVRKA